MVQEALLFLLCADVIEGEAAAQIDAHSRYKLSTDHAKGMKMCVEFVIAEFDTSGLLGFEGCY